MPPWTFDPSTREYRDEETGRTLDEPALRPLLQQMLGSVVERTRNVTGELANNLITVPEWEIEMRRSVKEAFGASYLLSRGGRNVMQPRDWGIVGQQVRKQYRFLNEFSQQVAAAGLTRDRALARSELYPLAARQAYARGSASALGDPALPAWPGDGSTRCLSNCGCVWDIERISDEEWDASWVISPQKESCVDCQGRSSTWNPLRVGPRKRRTRTPPPAEPEGDEGE